MRDSIVVASKNPIPADRSWSQITSHMLESSTSRTKCIRDANGFLARHSNVVNFAIFIPSRLKCHIIRLLVDLCLEWFFVARPRSCVSWPLCTLSD